MKKLILLLAFAACAFGQGSNTVFVKVFSNRLTTGVSQPLQNIGQSAHLLQVFETNAPAQSCGVSDIFAFVRLEASLDNSTWTPIGAPISSTFPDANGNLVGTSLAFGAFPYIRVNIVNFNVGPCALTVFYSGTLFPPNPSTLSAPQSNYLFAGGETNTGAGTYPIVSTPNGVGRIVLYGLLLINEGASATPVTISEKNVANCTGGVLQGVPLDLHTTGLAAGQSVSIPPSGVPFYSGALTANDTLCITLTNANAVYVRVIYRIE